MFADLLVLKPAPIVGARIVRPLDVAGEKDKTRRDLRKKLEEVDRKHSAHLRAKRAAAKAGDLAAYAQANRECRKACRHMREIRKQISEMDGMHAVETFGGR